MNKSQKSNILAAQEVANTVRSTLGPKGMDKMLVDSYGEIIVTNDGVTILKEITAEHPAAKIIVEVAKTQESEVGDGTTTAVILAGELLKNASKLLNKSIHPTTIIKGYRECVEKSNNVLENIAEKIKDDNKTLEKIAMTAMTGKGAELAKDKLARIVVKAVQKIRENDLVDVENIKIEKIVGGDAKDSEIIEGVVIDKERINIAMPKEIKKAKVALLACPIEIRGTEVEAKIQITRPEQMNAFLEQEEKTLLELIKKIKKTGANVIFCQKGIDDIAHHFLAKEGIYACRRVKQSDMRKLAKATSGKIVNDIEDLKKKDIGNAGLVEEKKVMCENRTFVSECKNAKAVTILINGGTEHIVDEVKRAVDDAIGDVKVSLENHLVVGGAGSTEVEISRNIKHYAQSLFGEEKEVAIAFAKAMEIIPRTLVESAGLDFNRVFSRMIKKHNLGKKWAGIDVFSGKIINSFENGVIEPLKIKTKAINSSVEVANMILRIDDVLLSGPAKNENNSIM